MSEGINLLDPNKQSTSSAILRRLRTMRVVMIGLLFFVSVASVMLFILVTLSPLPSLQKQEQSLRLTLAQSKNDMIKFSWVSEQASTIDTILANRHTIDQTIDLILSKLPSDTTVTAIQVQKNSMSLTIESQSLQSLDTFITNLIGIVQGKKVFSQLNLTDLSIDSTNNAYSMTIQMVLL